MPKSEDWRRSQTCADWPGAGSVMAFLQARMGSTRLPGKVLMRIQGQSILERAIRRLRAARVVDEVAVLTTNLGEDDVIEEESRRLGAWIYRGSELDVLNRFQDAAEKYHPEIIIRATGDNPLIDIGSVERIVRAIWSHRLDYCMERELPYGSATEVITAGALARVHKCAQEPRFREHVTLYIKEHPEEFVSAFLIPPDSLRYSQIRLTVDTMEDFVFVDQLIRKTPEGTHPLPLTEYLPLALTI